MAWKNAAYAAEDWPLAAGEVPDRAGDAEEHREQAARLLQPERHRRGGQRVRGQLGHGRGGLVHPCVHLGRAGAERGQPGRGGQRVAGQRAGLVHRPGRGQPVHDLRAAAERGRGQPAAHHLAERHQVAGHALEAVPAGAGDPEAGQHLVHDQQRAVLAADVAEQLVEAVRRAAPRPCSPGRPR